jgi:hypothetical protein
MTRPVARSIIPAGTRLNGIYEIDEPIAAGGMGEIYKGHAIETGGLVAIKLIRADLAEAQAAFALFRREAAALHDLGHEAIVRYYVFSVDPVLQRPYLAMEYVEGRSLAAVLRDGPLGLEAVCRLMQRIASGLHAAHARGIVHRDVSPDNIIVPAGDLGRAKIIDFGIARSTSADSEATIIGTGFAGKRDYVSPEQLGLFGGEVTPRSDIYSLGLVLLEALRGTALDMGGTILEVVEKREQLPDLDGIDPRLRPLLERMLQPDPVDRPISMAEVAAFDPAPRISTDVPLRRAAAPIAGTARAKIQARPALLVLIAVALVAAAVGARLVVPGQGSRDAVPMRPVPELEPGVGASADSLSDVASLPNAAGARLSRSSEGRGAAARRFVQSYDGGTCFFARAVAASDRSVAIEGFGLSSAPFRALDEALATSIGIDAEIGAHEITTAQCPALGFLRVAAGSVAPAVSLDLAAGSFAAGRPLAGIVSGLDGREASVLLVGSDGAVREVRTTRDGTPDDGLSFSLEMPSDRVGTPQLVLAVAAPMALETLRIEAPIDAGRLFSRVLEEAERRNLPVAAVAGSFEIAN